jgi:hypothetical protein
MNSHTGHLEKQGFNSMTNHVKEALQDVKIIFGDYYYNAKSGYQFNFLRKSLIDEMPSTDLETNTFRPRFTTG